MYGILGRERVALRPRRLRAFWGEPDVKWSLIAACCALLSFRSLLADEASPSALVANGGFEEGADDAVPPGWRLWGTSSNAAKTRVARDSERPHAGNACLRIECPVGGTGYLVSSPQDALRPKADRAYTVTFWARADREGEAMFGLTGYTTLDPYKDAPIDGWQRLSVGPQWKRFSFIYYEGIELFRDRHAYVLLTFRPGDKGAEARTLWIDDVAIAEGASPYAGLVREENLVYDRLNHRLRPGERMEATVRVDKPLGNVSRAVGGVSFHRLCGFTGQPYDRQGAYTLDGRLEAAIRDMRLPMTRLYGVGDEPFGIEEAIDKAAALCQRIGVPPKNVPLELETQSAGTRLAPEVWAQAARHAAARGDGFRLWEVANEPFASTWGKETAFASPDDYVAHVGAVARAIRAVQPNAQIGIAMHPHNARWGNYVLWKGAGSYDFVAPHLYAHLRADRTSFEDAALAANFALLDRALAINALMRHYNPSRTVYQYDTEWGLHSAGPNGERADGVDRNANIYGTLHRAVRLIYYAREGMLRGASAWQMLGRARAPGFGILTQDEPEKRFMLYWLHRRFNEHVGERLLDVEGTAPFYRPTAAVLGQKDLDRLAGPYTPLLATQADDGRVYLVMANGSWEKAFPLSIRLQGFKPASATALVLSHDDMDGSPLVDRPEDIMAPLPLEVEGDVLRGRLPPHSVVFVTCRGE
jgi:hypothetical protein